MKNHHASRRALALCLLFTAPFVPPAAAQTDSATYEMTFAGDWTAADISDSSLPGGAHFTSVVGAPHAPDATLWAAGASASPGIENVAELGSTSRLRAEVSANAAAGPFISAGSSFIGPTSTVSATLTTTSARPEVSVISMIAPSPDWFVGVSKLSLRGADGWRNEISIDLYAWDAGTEDGGGWSLSNPATNPRGVVTYIGDSGKFNGRKLGTLTFERTDKDDPPAPADPDPDPDPTPDPEAEPPAPLYSAAALEHPFPLFADGDGFRGNLFLTNASPLDNRCILGLHGPGLDTGRFDDHPALTVLDANSAEFDPGAAGAGVLLTTTGEHPLAVGYATLACEQPAVARLLLGVESGGRPLAMTTMESARAGNVFRFPVLPELGRLGLAFANAGDLEAACAVEVETAQGTPTEGGSFAVPAESTFFRFLDEFVTLDADGGTAEVTCGRAVTALGVQLENGVFAALEAAETSAEESGEESQFSRVLPLAIDGAGFQSRLQVTNRSAGANRCELRLYGAGLNTARFANAAGVTRDGFLRAVLDLPGPDDRISMTSFGRHFFAYGHATLDCDGPVHASNLLSRASTESATAGLLGMTAISTAQPALAFRFPVIPRLGRMELFLSNSAEAAVACRATLEAAGRETALAAESPISVPGESTAVRFLDALFELPDDFAGGAVQLHCGGDVAAVSLLHSGKAFTALPPIVPAFDAPPPN